MGIFGGSVVTIAALMSACQQDTFSSDSAKQAALAAQAKDQVLDSIAGSYCGNMLLLQDSVTYQTILNLSRTDLTVHSAQTADPTSTVQSPTLVGSMMFPALSAVVNSDNANEQSSAVVTYHDLIHAMGGSYTISITDGFYDSDSGAVSLPFSIPGYTQGNFGQLTGTIANGNFSHGVWQSDSFSTVGTFDLTLCSGSPTPVATPSASPAPPSSAGAIVPAPGTSS